jgi:hypothetical protein
MNLTPAQLDRAIGALLGTAAGDALGAPYEFGPPRGPELEVAMTGGGVSRESTARRFGYLGDCRCCVLHRASLSESGITLRRSPGGLRAAVSLIG